MSFIQEVTLAEKNTFRTNSILLITSRLFLLRPIQPNKATGTIKQKKLI